MTNEQHIENLKKLKSFHNGSYGADIDRAIKALEQEPCEDCISRQETIEAFQMFRGYEANRTNAEWVDRIETVVKKLPPLKPQEPKADTWSIKEVADALKKHGLLEQEPKTGKWIYRSMKGNFCSKCNERSVWKFNYCPNCGCRMVEPQESEDKE